MKRSCILSFLIIFIFSSCSCRMHVDTRQYRKGFYITVVSDRCKESHSSLKSLPSEEDMRECVAKDTIRIQLLPVPQASETEKKIDISEKNQNNVTKKFPHDTIVPKSAEPKRRPEWMGMASLALASVAAAIHAGTGLPQPGIVLLWLLFLILTFIFAGISLKKIKTYPKDFKWRFIAIVAMAVAGILFVIAVLTLLGILPFFVDLFG